MSEFLQIQSSPPRIYRQAGKVINCALIATALLSFPAVLSASPITNHPGFKVELQKQDRQVTGTVVDEKGEPLPGVSISIKGTTRGTITDVNGKFSLQVPDDAVLVFSYAGYSSQEQVVGQRASIDVKLAVSEKSLADVVVVGYNAQKRSTLTGSVSDVKGAELVKSPQPNVSNSLAGRFSGVIANNRSGEPGYDGSSITIRGLATRGSNNVLVVVDGIPGQIGGLERLDPNDIESISVLKDASAAIYGNRAANGVILVTTKRGKTGKPTINYTFNQGFSQPTRLPQMADAPQYAQLVNEILYNGSPSGGLNQRYSAAQIENFRNGSDPLNYPNTDWIDATLKKVALQNQQSLSVNGGSEDVKYYLSLGTIYQDNLYKNGVTKYKQYNFRSNVDANITKRFKVSLSLSGRQEDRQYPTTGGGGIFRSIYRANPTVAPFYPNGLPTIGIEGENPALQVTDIGGINKNPIHVFNGILRATYQIPGVEGLSVDGFFSVDRAFNFSKNFSKPYSVYNYIASTNVYEPRLYGGFNNKPILFESQMNDVQLISNAKLNYTKKFGKHDIFAFVGYEQSRNRREYFDATRRNFLSSELPELSQGGTASTDFVNSGYSSNFTRQSVISKLTYNYNEKYMIEGQLRADGSSNFPAGKRWGYFPSVSGAWRISKEDWFANNVKFFNDLKFRASYGTLGNDAIGNFQYFDNFTIVRNGFVSGTDIQANLNLIKLANPNITWEVAKKLDIGLNAVFLKNFNIEAIYFNQNRTSLLTPRSGSVPAVTGIVNPYNGDRLLPEENIGEVNSKGFETTLGYNHSGKDFTWGVSGNVTYAKSKVIFLDDAPGLLPYQKITGASLNTPLLYRSIGLFRTAQELAAYPHVVGAKVGDLKFEDYNQDGVIDARDMVRNTYGNVPRITYGFTLNAAYKNFDFTALLAGQAQVAQYVLPESGTIGNFYRSWADNRFGPNTPDGTFPMVTERSSSAISGGLYPSTFWLNNASFLRLKNLQVGYNVNANFLSKIKVSALRVYFSAFNLFTISKVKDYDPEGDSGSGQFYPQQKIYNLGVNVKF
ncbi:SusC/RagA family TonB-linked outer membrane protein [Mucilaginibacter terrae]|uniref:TonB-linked SusC/RagA family outer membrane protein n=1 Tax=Mucilaginibacter terrae TaxID=1955052 RepID=A0ABU3H0C0_9SPHI|nr:TonB-dependent receptor [Mucilaginibacter terrae]MDT3405467.1 TonB-linked SusC/RagA family outer membrane protein [Mucilaginibacter terrae]